MSGDRDIRALPDGLPRFNWGAFLIPYIWGPAHGQWPGVFFLPALAFVDNVLRGNHSLGAWGTAVGMAMVVSTLVLLFLFATYANRFAWPRAARRMTLDTYLYRQRLWAVAGVVVALGMAVWIWAYIERYGPAVVG